MRFGLMQAKAGLCHILSRYEVVPCKDTPLTATYDKRAFILKMEKKTMLSFKRISL
jgi:hypothetical protein